MIDRVASQATLSKRQSKEIVVTMLATIMQTVSEGERVTLAGFGTFEPRQRQPRVGRNPQTGTSLNIPARKVPTFSASKSFRSKVANQLHILRIPPLQHRSRQQTTPSPADSPLVKDRIQSITSSLLGFLKT